MQSRSAKFLPKQNIKFYLWLKKKRIKNVHYFNDFILWKIRKWRNKSINRLFLIQFILHQKDGAPLHLHALLVKFILFQIFFILFLFWFGCCFNKLTVFFRKFVGAGKYLKFVVWESYRTQWTKENNKEIIC